KVNDRLVKQDQSLQTVHMLCRPRPLYNDLNKVAIGYKNPLCLTRAKQAQPALYNSYEILKDNHTQAKVYNTEDTLEIAEITRKRMNAKMTDPECVTHKIGDNIPNNQNGWIDKDQKEEEEDPKEEEEDQEEDPKGDDDDDMEIDDEAEVIDPYMDDGSNNPPPPNSKDEETPPTSPVIPNADGQPIPSIASFGQNFLFGESSSTTNLLTGNSKVVPTGPMCPNLGTAWKRLGKMEKLMSKRNDTEGRMKKKFKEQNHHFVRLGCDNIEMDKAARNVMSDLSGLKKLVKDLSDRFNKTMPPRKSTRGNPPPPLTQDTVNRMIKESVEAATRAEREREFKMKQIVLKDLTNEGAVATLGIEAVTKKTWAKMKVMMTEEFCLAEEIQMMECELWNLRVKEMDISSYTTRFNELVILCPGMVPTERKKVEAYIRGLSNNIKGELTSSEPETLNKVVRMTHTLMEQKVKEIAEREADNKKRK
nr:hypothetical protein [Tanacetum cinerariifolium]